MITQEKSIEVLDRLKRQSVTDLQELERVMTLVEKKHKDIQFIKFLQEECKDGKIVKTIQFFKEKLGEMQFAKLTKGL